MVYKIAKFAKMIQGLVVLHLFLMSATLYAVNSATPELPAVSSSSYLEVIEPSVQIPVPDRGVVYEVSDRVPLIQQTDLHYIVGIKGPDGFLVPAAFPLINLKKQGVGWVTNDGYLIFAGRTASTAGILKLEQKEALDILHRVRDDYKAVLSRGRHSVHLQIPGAMPGFELKQRAAVAQPLPPAPKVQDQASISEKTVPRKSPTRKGRKISVSYDADGMRIEDSSGNVVSSDSEERVAPSVALQPAQINFLSPEPPPAPTPSSEAIASAKQRESHEKVIQELKEVVMLEIVAELQKSKSRLAASQDPSDAGPAGEALPSRDDVALAPAEALPVGTDGPGADSAGDLVSSEYPQVDREVLTAKVEESVKEATQVLDQAATHAVEAAVADHPEFQEKEPGYLRFLTSHALMFQILLGVCILEGVLLVQMRIKNRKTEEAENTSSDLQTGGLAYSYNISGEAMISQPEPPYKPAVEGDLTGTLDGYSMGQVVQFFNSSGDDGVLTLKTDADQEDIMIFNNGQIIAATSGNLTGEDAVYAMLRHQHGNFSFRRTDTSDEERLILQDTMSLLLEGHRLVDEMGFDTV